MVDLRGVLSGLAGKRPVFHSEADFQVAFAWELQRSFPDSKIRLEYKPFPAERFYLDILFRLGQTAAAIELKYPTRRLSGVVHGESFELRDQAAQDVIRYDFVKDLVRLERIAREVPGTVGYAILLTNDSSYWKESLRPRSVDAAFRLDEARTLAGQLAWAAHAGAGTVIRREAALTLSGNYQLGWLDYSQVPSSRYGRFRYLLVEID
jgi:hypothetical protein